MGRVGAAGARKTRDSPGREHLASPMSRRDGIDVRPITEDRNPGLDPRADTRGSALPGRPEQETADRGAYMLLPRTLGAFDAGRCVATFRSFPQQLTTVGGAHVPAEAITNVSVTATHRRRGLLTRMMATDLTAAKERGDVVATLIAAEYPIYGRYGFGPATTPPSGPSTSPGPASTPAGRPGRRRPHRPGGRRGGAEDRPGTARPAQRTQPGVVSRVRALVAGEHRRAEARTARRGPSRSTPCTARRTARWRAWSPTRPTTTGRREQPLNTADREMADRSDPRRRARPVALPLLDRLDHPGQDRLACPRRPAPRTSCLIRAPPGSSRSADWLWVRILDVVRAMEARTYAGAPGLVVLDVTDGDGLSAGRYRLDAVPGRARCCAPSARERRPHLDVRELSALWLGDASAVRLAALGPGAGRTSGRRPRGRRPAPHVQASVVPGHLLNRPLFRSWRLPSSRLPPEKNS